MSLWVLKRKESPDYRHFIATESPHYKLVRFSSRARRVGLNSSFYLPMPWLIYYIDCYEDERMKWSEPIVSGLACSPTDPSRDGMFYAAPIPNTYDWDGYTGMAETCCRAGSTERGASEEEVIAKAVMQFWDASFNLDEPQFSDTPLFRDLATRCRAHERHNRGKYDYMYDELSDFPEIVNEIFDFWETLTPRKLANCDFGKGTKVL